MNKATQPTKLVVLGTAHEFQGEKFPNYIDDKCYRDLVEQLIDVYKIDFIFEEAAGYRPTHAEALAKTRPESIGYTNVDPPREERCQHGLSTDTGEGYVVDLWQEPPCIARMEHVADHAAREEHWLKKIQGQEFTFGLMICGHSHCLSVSFRLRAAGFDVEDCINYLPYNKLCGHNDYAALQGLAKAVKKIPPPYKFANPASFAKAFEEWLEKNKIVEQ